MNKFPSGLLSLLFLVIIMTLVLSGCGVPNIKVEEQIDKNVFVKGAVMKKFPPVPIYPETEIIESYSSSENYGVTSVVDDTLDKVVDFYQKAFVQLGWENSLIRQTESNYILDFKSSQYRGSVTVNTASDNKKTAISIVVSPR